MYHKIYLFIIVISSITIILINALSYIRYKQFIYDVNVRKKPSKLLTNFPVVQTSQKSYLETTNKVESFLGLIAKGNKVELKLSDQELNHLYTKGNSINIYLPGRYLYYEVENNYVIEHLIEWPLFDTRPCFYRKKRIDFFMEGDKAKIKSRHIERYLKKVKDAPYIGDLISCPLIIFIFKMSSDPFCLPFNFEKKNYEYKEKAKIVLDKIKFVDVANGELILRS